MASGLVRRSTLTDIGNAIRVQSGTSGKLKPSVMAGAVSGLDGTLAGDSATYPAEEGVGLIERSTLAGIADAIRSQNGQATTYKPSEMAAAILALTWAKTSLRALLLSDGTLEVNYTDNNDSLTGGTVSVAYELDAAGYSSASAVPWYAKRESITSVVIDSTVADAGVASCSYWFHSCKSLVEVSGFQYLSGITSAVQMFASCTSLESIYAASFNYSAVSSSNLMFYRCTRLVGGTDGYVPADTDSAKVCKVGSGGVLTNPDADKREWFKVYADTYRITLTRYSDESNYYTTETGRLCANASYRVPGLMPGYSSADTVSDIIIKSDMATFSEIRCNYWFYGFSEAINFTNLRYLANVTSLRYTFAACSSVKTISLTEFDPSRLKDLAYTFFGCTSLYLIYADSTWVLPSGASGTMCFYNCTSLRGGNWTLYSSSHTDASYMRIDTDSTPGYLLGV